MSAKMWEITIEHARTCVLDNRVYLYYSPVSQHRNGVVFNVVGQVIGFYSESQYVPLDKLSENDKVGYPIKYDMPICHSCMLFFISDIIVINFLFQIDAQRMATEAFQHWDGVISFEDMNSLVGMSSQTASPLSTETTDNSKVLSSQRINTNSIDYAQTSISSPDNFSPLYSLGCLGSPDDFPLHGLDGLDLRFDQALDIPVQISSSMFCPSHSMSQAFPDDEHLGFMDIDYPTIQSTNMGLDSQTDLQSAFSGFITPHSPAHAVRGQAYRRWRVLSSILRWFRVRRQVVTRRTPCPTIQRYR